MTAGVFDTGLQPERTELAWRRTALTLGTASVVSIRLLPALLDGVPWMFPGLVGAVIAAVILVAARYRYVDVTNELMGRTRRGLPGGGLILFVATVTSLTGLTGGLVVLLFATS